jgi:ribosome modulation factor
MNTIKMTVLSLILTIPVLTFSQTQANDIEAGLIISTDEAKTKCPEVCGKQNMKWDGNWRTTVEGQMSVCACLAEKDIEAGPIISNDGAKTKCPPACAKENMKWTGNWKTTEENKQSVCHCQG